MGFVLSWSGYFSRKGWDPRKWAEANNIKSYEQCARRVSKMCVTPPTKDQYEKFFLDTSVTDSAATTRVSDDTSSASSNTEKVEVYVKELKSEQPKEEKVVDKTPKVKSTPRRRAAQKSKTPPRSETGSGTSSIIDSVKKPTKPRRTRSRKNVKSS